MTIDGQRWRKLDTTTLGVVWNLIGHEGNISRVAAGLPVNKAARITKANLQRITKIKTPRFSNFQKVEEPNPPFQQL